MRIILIRHGQPHIALAPRGGHRDFARYIDDYEAAGLAPASLPPDEVRELTRELDTVFTSGRARSQESAARLAPHAVLIADPLFVEAPLASPPLPLLKMKVPKWAVMSRLLWHAGFHPKVEAPRAAHARAEAAADMLMARARAYGSVALVAHGYFNWMIGRILKRRGFVRTGSHRARYWNTVIYESTT